MTKVTITRISCYDKKKDGTPLEGKYGPFFRVGLQTEEHGEEWLNGFMNNRPTFEVGDEIHIDVAEEEYQGKTSLKFRISKQEDIQLEEKDAKIAELEAKLAGKDEEKDDDKTEEVKDENVKEPF